MRKNLDLIIEALKNENQSWLEEKGIVSKDKGDYWILNYHQIADKNEFNVLTRGLVVSKKGEIASCPFYRFFNFGEPLAAKIDFSNSDVIEKLDGSLVTIFFPEGLEKPHWHFRSLMSCHQKDRDFAVKNFNCDEENALLMSVEPFLKELSFSKAVGYDTENFSLVFEYVSKINAVVTKYDPSQYGLYLIGARYVPSLQELDEDALDALARVIGVRRPRRWRADSYEQVVAMMSDFPKDYEGFVVRNRDGGERIKIKSEDYLKRHRLLTKLNYRTLIPLFFDGETDEIISYFPQAKVIFEEIRERYEKHSDKCYEVLKFWKDKSVSRKEVALGIVGKEEKEVCSVVFKLIDQDLDKEKVREAVRRIGTESLIRAWRLKEVGDVVTV